MRACVHAFSLIPVIERGVGGCVCLFFFMLFFCAAVMMMMRCEGGICVLWGDRGRGVRREDEDGMARVECIYLH